MKFVACGSGLESAWFSTGKFFASVDLLTAADRATSSMLLESHERCCWNRQRLQLQPFNCADLTDIRLK